MTSFAAKPTEDLIHTKYAKAKLPGSVTGEAPQKLFGGYFPFDTALANRTSR